MRWPRRSSTAACRRTVCRTSASRGNYSRARSRRRVASGFRRCTPFAERLLRIFPFEANVPAHFKVHRRARDAKLMCARRAMRRLPVSALRRDAGKRSELVAREAGAFKFDELLRPKRWVTPKRLTRSPKAQAYGAALRTRWVCRPADGSGGRSRDARRRSARQRREVWAKALETGTRNDRNFAARLRAADDDDGSLAARVQSLLEAFFTDGGEGDPRLGTKGCLAKAPRENLPPLEAELRGEQDRLASLRERRLAADVLERSEALFVVGKAILTAFARRKAERGALDFDDQIARRAGAGHAIERRLGAAQARLRARSPVCSTKPRTLRRRNGAFSLR